MILQGGMYVAPPHIMSKGLLLHMLISEAIQAIQDYCDGIDAFAGKPIELATTRDQVLYGDIDQQCTGIVTCIWATAEVIRRAKELGANLIVPHEALFWNHGDRREVVAGNKTFEAKCALLDEWGGAVWRCHDYIHSGVPLASDGSMVDGIFYGFAVKMDWLGSAVDETFMRYRIEPTPARDLAQALVHKLGLNGTRLIGDGDALVRNVEIPMHIMGRDNDEIAHIDSEGIDCILTMEFIDFTVSEYIRDAAMLGQGKCAIHMGHFNGEEPGMEYMAKWLPAALGDASAGLLVTFVPMGDTYQYVLA